jgi:hypothetical protein
MGCMDLKSESQELYRLAPSAFTAARDTKASEARKAGHPELASSLKKLRRPSVGAWLANLLVLEQRRDVERLITLGDQLRTPKHDLDGEWIRQVSKEKGEAVTKLVRDASSRASRMHQPVSAAALEELEATLDAAFADPEAAETLREGRLSRGLHYSGLGFVAQPQTGSLSRTQGSATNRGSRSRADQVVAQRDLEKAKRAEERADADVVKARRAVGVAAAELKRLKSAEALAVRRSKEAHDRVSAATKKLRKRGQV